MNVLVVGVGSIGTRHLENLVALGHTVRAVDVSPDRRAAAAAKTAGTFETLDAALESADFDAAFICTFSNDHIAPAIRCVRAGCHVFIEKPLSTTLDGIDELIDTLTRTGRTSMVGCNMRFHPGIAAVHDAVATGALGRCLWAGIEYGFSLQRAKPDYPNSYMARRSLGGNLIFDVIHELDYAVWMLGDPVRVVCRRGIVSDLTIDTEDTVDMLVEFASGATAAIHLDYLQHDYSRRCKVIAERGTAVWDFAAGTVGLATTEAPTWTWQDLTLDIYYNRMFLDEAASFLDCAATGRQTLNPVPEALGVLKLAVAAERSCQSRQWEPV